MVALTVNVTDELAERVAPLGSWLPTVLELSLIGFETTAAATATEFITFLHSQPSPAEVLAWHVSERSQARLRRLLALNEAGLLGEVEQQELNELEQIEHIVVMLKTQIAQQMQQRN